MSVTRTVPVGVLGAAVLSVVLGGCRLGGDNRVLLARVQDDRTGPTRFRWSVNRAVFVADARGQYELLAESPPGESDKPIHQWLYVKTLWDVSPARTGADESALNARVGYLIRTDPNQPDAKTLYYEGMGHLYTDRPLWLWGKRRFQVRHAPLRLTRSDRERPVDPFGPIELEADLVSAVDSGAAARIEQVVQVINKLRHVAPTTAPAGE